jgi:hypothetical protein
MKRGHDDSPDRPWIPQLARKGDEIERHIKSALSLHPVKVKS